MEPSGAAGSLDVQSQDVKSPEAKKQKLEARSPAQSGALYMVVSLRAECFLSRADADGTPHDIGQSCIKQVSCGATVDPCRLTIAATPGQLPGRFFCPCICPYIEEARTEEEREHEAKCLKEEVLKFVLKASCEAVEKFGLPSSHEHEIPAWEPTVKLDNLPLQPGGDVQSLSPLDLLEDSQIEESLVY